MAQNDVTKIDDIEDLGTGSKGTAALWSKEITASRKFLDKYKKSAVKINKRYVDKRTSDEEGEFRVNLFWSTIQVVMSMLYAQPPKADVKRLYDDYSDEASRVGSEILERILNNDIQLDGSTSNAAIRYAVQDWVVLGLGVVWGRYSVDTEMTQYDAVMDPMTGAEIEPGGQYERITDEDAPIEYIHWDDFNYSPCRIWEECRWVSKRVFMTREQLVTRFGDKVGKAVPMAQKNPQQDGAGNSITIPQDPWNKAEVFEIWDKRTKKVFWFNTQCDYMLDEKDDPLQLDDFFPCPPPLMANTTSMELIPRADYVLAQDQFNQLDDINTRIGYLTKALKVVGVYDKSAEGVQRLLQEAVENELIPVDNWALFSEGGGLKSKVDWLPVADVAAVVEKLVGLREGVKGQIYEVLGISDIMRGNTKASETASAQQIKAQFGSTRIQLKQFFVANFVQKALSIKAEIIERHFQPETIAKRSNIMASPDAPHAQEAIQLLKNPEESKYRVTVQADSLAYIDRKAENDSRTAALTAIGQFMQQASGLAKEMPGAAPFLLQMVQWYSAGFKGFQDIEGIMDQAIQAAKQAALQPPKPNPMLEAEIAEKQALIVERKATAILKLADAEVKTVQAHGLFPAPPEQFVGGMPSMGGMGAQGMQPPPRMQQQGMPPPMPHAPMPPPSMPPQGMPPEAQPQPGLPPAIPQGMPHP